MDIDITDSTFSLDVPKINHVMSSGEGILSSDYMMYIYVGGAVLVILIGIIIFKFYQNKKQNQNDEDCSGGFCTMNQANS
jgi:hypothetical protein